jgi:hypothetical protein
VAKEVGMYQFGHLNLHVIAQAKCDCTLMQAIGEGRPPDLDTVFDMGRRIQSAMKEGWHVGDIHASSWGQLPNGVWCLLDAGCLYHGGKTKVGDVVKSFRRSLNLFPNLIEAFDKGCRA